jgi:NADH dehydrogenase
MATRALANEFHSIEPEEARVLLFDGGSCVLETFAPDLTHKATRILHKLGVEQHMGVHVTDVRQDGVTVVSKTDGSSEGFSARTVLWTAGVEAVPFARRVAEVLGAESDHAGRIAVEPDLSVPGHPEVFVIGDLVGRDRLPGVAENAMQGGMHAAACVRDDLDGKARRPYRYRDLGSAAYLCRGHALLQAGPVKLAGFFGWLGWGLIHIAFLAGLENRISTVATWLAAIAGARRTDRTFILGTTTSPEHPYTWLKIVHRF